MTRYFASERVPVSVAEPPLRIPTPIAGCPAYREPQE